MGSVFRALLGLLVYLTAGCSVHHHYGRPYAYGIEAADWVIEEQAQRCAASCGARVDDAHLLCMSRCPGFVTADVSTCRDVPEWEACAIGYETPLNDTAHGPDGRNRTGEKVALGTLRVLGSVVVALIEASDDDEDDGEDEVDEARGRSETKGRKKGTHSRKPRKPKKPSARHPKR